MKEIRNAIVGLGRIGSSLSKDRLREKPCTHAGVITAHPDCILVGGCDINKNKQKEFAKRWNCPSVFLSADVLLKETKPDILHVATPPEVHLEMVEKALDYGVKLVICEKPLADNLSDANKIEHIHCSGKLKILTNHERRYSADYLRVKKIIENKQYGELLSISSKLYMKQTGTLYSLLWSDGTHLVDIIQFLSSSYLIKIGVYGNLNDNKGSTYIYCSAGDVPVSIEVGNSRDHLVFEIDLSFTRGRIRIGNGMYEEYISRRSPYYEGFNSLINRKSHGYVPTGYFINMLEDAVRCARNKVKNPVSSAVDGYQALAFISSLK